MKALLSVSALAILSLLLEMFNLKRLLLPVLVLGLLAAIGITTTDWNTGVAVYNNMLRFDNYSVAFSILLMATTALLLPLAQRGYLGRDMQSHESDSMAVLLFGLAGGIIMTCFSNLVLFFVGLEILSISFYILAGSRKRDLLSNESAYKYFLMGAFSTGFLLFGITLLYGATGSFNLEGLRDFATMYADNLPIIYKAGVLLVAVGLLFKVSAAPFHFWAPDVYEGAPTWVTAVMATVVKTASFAAFYRVFSSCFAPAMGTWVWVFWGATALTLFVGNLSAVLQPGVKRMLAFSSISHAGYMMLALMAMNQMSAPGGLLLYLAAYSLASIAAFAVLIQVIEKHGNDALDAFNGLARSNPLLAFAMTVALLSMAGIPPLAGFFAKYYLFNAAFQSGFYWLVGIGVVNALIGVYYYFRIIGAMFVRPIPETGGPAQPLEVSIVALLATVAGVVLGLMPTLLTNLL